MHPLLRLGEVRMEFWVLGEVIQNIFDFLGGLSYEWGLLKKFKIFCQHSNLIFSIHILRFEMDAGLQVDINFNTDLNLVQWTVSFHPLVDTQNQPKQ